MRPDFEHMTVAELNAYCSYIRKFGISAHRVLINVSRLSDPVHDKLFCEAGELANKLEVLGLSSVEYKKENKHDSTKDNATSCRPVEKG